MHYFYSVMKKIFVLFLFVFALSRVSAQQDKLSNWSFTVEYGLSRLDGDEDSSIKQVFGASVEYAFLPFAGLAIDYYHLPQGGPAFSTELNSAALNLTININRLLFSRLDDKVILKGYLGYGMARYTSTYYATATSPKISVSGSASSFPVAALSVEFYVTPQISLGAKTQFRPFNVNNLEGDPRYNLDNVYNDNIVAATLFLRLKLYSAN